MSSWLPAHWAQSAGGLLSLLLDPSHWKGGSPLLRDTEDPWLHFHLAPSWVRTPLAPPKVVLDHRDLTATNAGPFSLPHSRLLLWEALLGPLLSLSTVVIFSVTSTLDGEREGESAGWGRVSELGGALERPLPYYLYQDAGFG